MMIYLCGVYNYDSISIQHRFDGRSTEFDCLTKIIKVAVT